MKLKIFWAVLFTAIAVAAGWNYSQSQNEVELSDLALANVEALASGEGGGSCNWATREVSAGWEAICISGGPGYS
uniref:NVEALA domain-containing protein n=1 Tax=uncultured Parabacteroides sp. TaxID=512312 RepID=UPI002598310D